MENIESLSIDEIKELGNAATKKGNYEEAMLHYTHGIKRDQKNFALYSNRSFAFLKLGQYSLAMEDAIQTILLNPEWPKGYFRRGEVEFATGNYADAQKSYEIAFKLKPDDVNIYACIEKARVSKLHEETKDAQIPWVGAGVGIVIGVIILIADYSLTNHPTNPLLMAFATIAISLVGFFIAKFLRSASQRSKKSMIDVDSLFEGNADASEDEPESESNGKTRNRYTKSQARQRFRKGKQ